VSSLVTGCRRDLYPSLQSNLAEFRQHLVDSMADMAPLKVWQLQGTHVFVHAWISACVLSPKVMCTSKVIFEYDEFSCTAVSVFKPKLKLQFYAKTDGKTETVVLWNGKYGFAFNFLLYGIYII